MQAAARTLTARRSYRVATRRRSLRRQNMRSMALRSRSRTGERQFFQHLLALGGMFGSVPLSSTCRRIDPAPAGLQDMADAAVHPAVDHFMGPDPSRHSEVDNNIRFTLRWYLFFLVHVRQASIPDGSLHRIFALSWTYSFLLFSHSGSSSTLFQNFFFLALRN